MIFAPLAASAGLKIAGFFKNNWKLIAVVVFVAAGAWTLDHRAYQRATSDAEARQTEDKLAAEERARRMESVIGAGFGKIDGKLGAHLAALKVLEGTVVRPIEAEIALDPRYRDPACALTPVALTSINKARGASSVTVALPAE